MDVVRHYIHGRYVDSDSDETFQTIDPATEEVIAGVQQASDRDVDRAVKSSRAGFAEWSSMTGAERGRILNRAARILREHNEELARLEVLDTGKPIAEAIAVYVQSGADCIEYFAGMAATLRGDHYDLGSDFAYTRRVPLGVVDTSSLRQDVPCGDRQVQSFRMVQPQVFTAGELGSCSN